MKKREKEKKVEFWVSLAQKKKILENMKRNGMNNLSEFMRILALSNAEINFSVKVPNVMRVSEAHLGSTVEAEEERPQKRALGQ